MFCCPNRNRMPILELFIGAIGTNGSSNEEDGIFLRIANPKSVKAGDVVYARHRTARSTTSRSTNTRLFSTRLMRTINGQGLMDGICPWWDNFKPITALHTLSETSDNGNTYSWVKILDTSTFNACIRKKVGRFYWAGNHQLRSIYDDTSRSHMLTSGRFYNFTAFEYGLFRKGQIIATSNKYLLSAYGYQHNDNYYHRVNWREIDTPK